MRFLISLLVLFPSLAFAQTPAERAATLKYVASLQDETTGAFRPDAKGAPGLRATSAAVRATKYLGGELANKSKVISYVLSRYDKETGGFAEPGEPPNVAVTSVGVMAAVELDIEETKFPMAVVYLHSNAKSFEDVRIGAAALDSLKKKPTWLDNWIKVANDQLNNDGTAGKGDGLARDTASVVAMKLRLGYPVANRAKVIDAIKAGQRPSGGWGKAGAKAADGETTYRAVRAIVLAKEYPRDGENVRNFFAACRNADGGYGTAPGEPSSIAGTYYCAVVTKWLETKK